MVGVEGNPPAGWVRLHPTGIPAGPHALTWVQHQPRP